MEKVILTKMEMEKIFSLYEKDESIRGIGKLLNRSQSLIQRVLNERNRVERFSVKKNYIAVCKKTKKEFKDYNNTSGILISHIIEEYPEIIIPSKFIRKKFEITNSIKWYEQFFNIIEFSENLKETFKCKLCVWETMDLINSGGAYTKHITKVHNIDSKKYLELFPEDTNLFNTFVKNELYKEETEENTSNFIECAICNEKMRKISNTHVKKHGISLQIYRKKFGNTMSSKTREKFVELGIKSSEFVVIKKKDTNIERKIKEVLNDLDIKYEHQFKKGNYYFDFFLPDENILIETDGVFWHGYDRESNWDYSVFNNVINDYQKSKENKNLFRILETDIMNINNFDSKNSFFDFLKTKNIDIAQHKIFNLKENDVLFSKEYCINKFDINNKNTIKLIKNILFLWKNFYNPENNKKFINLDERKDIGFKLKGVFFNQFYSAHKINNKNLFEVFKSDEMLEKTIKYRLGINNAKEYFDFTIKNLYRGIEVRTLFNVGIFPVKRATEIYESNVYENELVYDPFSGWGSRAISFGNIIKKENCKYLGSDINSSLREGYNYILNNEILKKENIILEFRDSTILREELINKIDFIFTSPPFFNDEIYEDNTIVFNSLEEWSNKLLIPVFKNCFYYLKSGKKMIIDMKELYVNETIICAEKCGFKLLKKEDYNIAKTHYGKNNKKQFLLEFIKN